MNFRMKTVIFFAAFLSVTGIASAEKTAPKTVPNTPPTAVTTASTADFVVVTTPSTTEKYEGLAIASATEVTALGKKHNLQLVSHGVRKKKVFGLATVKVYLTEFLAEKAGSLSHDEKGFLESIKKTVASQVRLTLLRDLSGKKITQSFVEALETNKVNVENPSKELKDVLDILNKITEFKTNETFTLTTLWSDKDDEATLIVQSPDGSIKTVKGPSQFAVDLYSIWFGTPVDGKMEELKKVLIK